MTHEELDLRKIADALETIATGTKAISQGLSRIEARLQELERAIAMRE